MKLKIWFADFWDLFNKYDNYFIDVLKKIYEIELDEKNPDVLFFSVFGVSHWGYNCRKIMFIGENIRPDFEAADFSFSFDHDSYNGKNFRLPLYCIWNDPLKLLNKPSGEELLASKTKFCNFVFSNASATKRIDFFRKLSKYKKVDSGGRLLNNIGYRIKDKLEFQSRYKFSIAFENEEYPGYTTEKIFEPMLAGSVPIYWGNPLVEKDFNTKSFLNYNDFRNDDELIERIIELDNNDDLYLDMLRQPWFKDGMVNEFASPERITEIFRQATTLDFSPHPKRQKILSPDGKLNKLLFLRKQFSFKFRTIFRYKLKNISWRRISIYMQKRTGN